MLIAQANVEGFSLSISDAMIAAYGNDVLLV
jgi:hypothetical protein